MSAREGAAPFDSGRWEAPRAADLDIGLDPAFVGEREAARWLEELRSSLPWRQESIRIFGKTMPVPRLQSWHGDPGAGYRYSGLDLEPLPWTPLLTEIRGRIEAVVGGPPFNAVLANLYRDGRDSMGWHADDEPELGPEPVIASLSLGASRTFHLRHRTRRELGRLDLQLGTGSLLVMRGRTQECWQHALPKRTGRSGPGLRINLTFRRIILGG
ncbi:MAG: alpha-ketoglutarate-dependent dioxygenase AlkB family protein [Planctomycetota bacterium]